MTENPTSPPPSSPSPAPAQPRMTLKASAPRPQQQEQSQNSSGNNGEFAASQARREKAPEVPVDKRLKESSADLIAAFEKWNSGKSAKDALEKLQETMHEQRKVMAAIEIAIALSEKDGQSQASIIPPRHRSNSPKRNDGNEE